jgi:squalene-hopene/tetraprenyl-beta-curcumene cyclase
MKSARLSRVFSIVLTCALWLAAAVPAQSAEEVTLETVSSPAPNRADEPIREALSLEQAAHFLDSAALDWQQNRKCMTCHTNYLYLAARPALGTGAPALATVRQFAEELVRERWPDVGPRWDAEVVMTGSILALFDEATSGQLHETTRTALDRMWTVQREDGGFDWLKCDWPPMEIDDHYGATMAAIGAGAAPGDYAASPQARAGLDRLREYFAATPPEFLHHKAMLLWAGSYIPGLVTDEQKGEWAEALLALQVEDGGWASAALGHWQRADDTQQVTDQGDSYGTGLVIYVLRRNGLPADHPQIVRGLDWIRTHQRESGRWFTRSLHQDGNHFLTHAGSAMAVLALDACGALQNASAAAGD